MPSGKFPQISSLSANNKSPNGRSWPNLERPTIVQKIAIFQHLKPLLARLRKLCYGQLRLELKCDGSACADAHHSEREAQLHFRYSCWDASNLGDC